MEQCREPQIKLEDFHKFFNVFEISFELYTRKCDDIALGPGCASVGYHYEKSQLTERFEVCWEKEARLDTHTQHGNAEECYEAWLQKHKKALARAGALGWGLGATIFSKPTLIKNVQLIATGIRCSDPNLQAPSSERKVVRKDYWRD